METSTPHYAILRWTLNMRMTGKNLNVIQWHLMILEAQQPIILDYIKDP